MEDPPKHDPRPKPKAKSTAAAKGQPSAKAKNKEPPAKETGDGLKQQFSNLLKEAVKIRTMIHGVTALGSAQEVDR